jgi:hypothetical protein
MVIIPVQTHSGNWMTGNLQKVPLTRIAKAEIGIFAIGTADVEREKAPSSSHKGTKLTKLSGRGPGEEKRPVLVPLLSTLTLCCFPRIGTS